MATPAELSNLKLVADSMDCAGLPDLGDDALIYHGSATWDMWQCHVPKLLRAQWARLSEEARLCVYLTAKSVTNYKAMH